MKEDTTISRRGVLKAIGGLALGGSGLIGRTRAHSTGTPSEIPTVPTLYRIRMAGQTSHGQFDQLGQFFVTPSAELTPTNPRDVALTAGNPQGAPEVGSIAFYTNTGLRTTLGMGGAQTVNDARIKIGTVEVDEASGRLRAQPRDDQGIDLPPGVRAGLQVNVFTPRAGIVAPLYELIAGRLDVQFHDGNQVSGYMEFLGVSLGGAADQAWLSAQFVGIT